MGEFMSALAGGMQGAGSMMFADQQRKKQREWIDAMRGAGAGGPAPAFGIAPGTIQPIGTPMQDIVSGGLTPGAMVPMLGLPGEVDPFIMEMMRRKYPGIFGG